MPEGMEIGMFDVMGFGMWISLLVAIVGILVSLGVIKSRSA